MQSLPVQQEFWKSIARMAMHQAWEKYKAPQVSIRLAPRAVIVNKAFKQGSLQLLAFSTSVAIYKNGQKQAAVVEMISNIKLQGASYGVGIIPQIKLDSDNGKDLFAVPYWCAQRGGDLANSNMEATVVSQTVQVGSQTYECDVPAFTNSVKLAKGDEVKIYMCKTESAASLSEPATKRGRH